MIEARSLKKNCHQILGTKINIFLYIFPTYNLQRKINFAIAKYFRTYVPWEKQKKNNNIGKNKVEKVKIYLNIQLYFRIVTHVI